MTAKMKRLLYIVLGLFAGSVTWGLEELILRLNTGYLFGVLLQGAVMGAVFGYSLGSAEGIAISEPRKALFTGFLGAGIGAVAGGAATFAAAAGMIWVANTFGTDYRTTLGVLLPVSRIAAWGIVGMVVGMTEGLRSLSMRCTIAGLLGGITGGLVGGSALEGLMRVIPNPAIGRVIGFIVLGTVIGFFLGEFERRFSFARLKVLTGPLKNKEYVLSRSKTSIGSGIASEVYLSLYAGLEGRHVDLRVERGEMRLEGVAGKVKVNEKTVGETRFLKYQDVIEVGNARLLLLPA
jgi:hypothetical protein